uniref:Uncharacterized protein n=1 Tax=Anopheles coluzzii TaxID=1518534 RepID=A0A8W7P212_ANOCL
MEICARKEAPFFPAAMSHHRRICRFLAALAVFLLLPTPSIQGISFFGTLSELQRCAVVGAAGFCTTRAYSGPLRQRSKSVPFVDLSLFKRFCCSQKRLLRLSSSSSSSASCSRVLAAKLPARSADRCPFFTPSSLCPTSSVRVDGGGDDDAIVVS